MSSFEPNKLNLRELLIYFFNLKKYAAEEHRLLVERYDEAALSERSCRDGQYWRWTILRIKHKVPFFHNKCPIFDKKRPKLVCTTDIIARLIRRTFSKKNIFLPIIRLFSNLFITIKWNNKQIICILWVPKHSFKTIYSLPKQLKLLCKKFQLFHTLRPKNLLVKLHFQLPRYLL